MLGHDARSTENLLFLSLLALAACATRSEVRISHPASQPKSAECLPERQKLESVKNHIYTVDERGWYLPMRLTSACAGVEVSAEQIGWEKGQEGRANIEERSRREKAGDEQIEAMLSEIQHSGATDVIVFIHGGRNSLQDSLARAIAITPRIESEGARSYFPIFINWNSSEWSTYPDQYRYYQGIYYDDPPIKLWLAPYFFATDLGEAIARWMSSLTRTTLFPRLELASDGALADCVGQNGDFAKSGRYVGFHCRDTRIAYDNGEVYPLRTVRLVSTPLIDAFGIEAWNGMLARTRVMFHRADEFTGADNHLSDAKGEGAVSRLFLHLTRSRVFVKGRTMTYRSLTDRSGKNPGERSVKITIVAHSMGAIVANQALQLFPDLDYSNIVYMAAAAGIFDTRAAVVPIVRAYSAEKDEDKVRFYNLSLDPKREVFEENLYGAVPWGSLLVWIDNLYATPATFGERTVGTWLNSIKAAHLFDRELREQGLIQFVRFGLEESDPRSHGGFTQCDWWREAFWQGWEYKDNLCPDQQ